MGKRLKKDRTLSRWSIFSYGIGGGGVKFGTLIVDYAMLFMTDYIGLDATIVAMLIAISKVLDAVTDIIAGTIIDRTRHKMGKARIWILRMIPLMALANIAMFFIPTQTSDVVQYIYFFITYTLFSDVFYTMHAVAHSTMVLYATGRSNERAFLSIGNFAGTTLLGIIVTASYLNIIAAFGGGVQGWRALAIIFSIVFAVTQLIYVFSVKEQPDIAVQTEEKKQTSMWSDLVVNIKYLLHNRYFLLQLGVMLLYTISFGALTTIVPYYCLRVLGDVNNAAGTQTTLGLVASGVVVGLLFSAVFLKKFGLYKSNLYTRLLVCVGYIPVIIGALNNNFTLILIGELLFYVFQGPYLGSVGVLLGEICEYSKLKFKVSLEATVSSCNSFGTKVGNALGVALVGWMLGAVNYDGTLAVQPQSSIDMINFIFVVLPIVCQIIIAVLLAFMDVEKANKKLRAAQQPVEE